MIGLCIHYKCSFHIPSPLLILALDSDDTYIRWNASYICASSHKMKVHSTTILPLSWYLHTHLILLVYLPSFIWMLYPLKRPRRRTSNQCTIFQNLWIFMKSWNDWKHLKITKTVKLAKNANLRFCFVGEKFLICRCNSIVIGAIWLNPRLSLTSHTLDHLAVQLATIFFTRAL